MWIVTGAKIETRIGKGIGTGDETVIAIAIETKTEIAEATGVTVTGIADEIVIEVTGVGTGDGMASDLNRGIAAVAGGATVATARGSRRHPCPRWDPSGTHRRG